MVTIPVAVNSSCSEVDFVKTTCDPALTLKTSVFRENFSFEGNVKQLLLWWRFQIHLRSFVFSRQCSSAATCSWPQSLVTWVTGTTGSWSWVSGSCSGQRWRSPVPTRPEKWVLHVWVQPSVHVSSFKLISVVAALLAAAADTRHGWRGWGQLLHHCSNHHCRPLCEGEEDQHALHFLFCHPSGQVSHLCFYLVVMLVLINMTVFQPSQPPVTGSYFISSWGLDMLTFTPRSVFIPSCRN